MIFYCYFWLRWNGSPYYVGKGQGDRAFIVDSHNVSMPKDHAQIILQYYPTEEDAFEAERFFISLFGRKDIGTGCLRNLTDGGENPPNWAGKKRSRHHSLACSRARRGIKQPNISLVKMGNTCGRFSKGIKRKSLNPERVQAIRQMMLLLWEERRQVGWKRNFNLSDKERQRRSDFMLSKWKDNPTWRKNSL